MKFLFITTRSLIPNNGGNTVRAYNIMKWLRELGHQVTWVTYASKQELDLIKSQKKELDVICDKFIPVNINRKLSYLNSLKAIFTGKPFKAEYHNHKNMRKILKKEFKENNYDYIYGYLYMTSQFLDMFPADKCWLDMVDSISMLYDRHLKTCPSLFKKLFLSNEQQRVLKIEKNSVEKYKLITMISDIDRQHLSQYFNTDKILIIKNGVRIDDRISISYNENEIIYLGDMAYIQNHVAVMWFIDNVMPKLIKHNPEIRLKIVGKNPKEELYKCCKDNKNVVITGQVEDVKKELLSGAVLICPIHISSGLQNKVLEAMSVGVPAIVTPQVAKPITNNSSVLTRSESIEEWENQITHILSDNEYRQELSLNSKQFIEDNFSWSSCLEPLKEFING